MGKKGFGYRVKQAEHVGKGKKNKKNPEADGTSHHAEEE